MSLPPALRTLAARMRASRGISSSVERQLPKLERRVRFPYPALDARRVLRIARSPKWLGTAVRRDDLLNAPDRHAGSLGNGAAREAEFARTDDCCVAGNGRLVELLRG